MTDKHFDAILAKNQIARELKQSREDVSLNNIKKLLLIIEEYIGEGNQPSVEDILQSKQNI
jgi:hypothetical protein